MSFSRGSSWPWDRTWVSCIGMWILYQVATREAHCFVYYISNWQNILLYISFCFMFTQPNILELSVNIFILRVTSCCIIYHCRHIPYYGQPFSWWACSLPLCMFSVALSCLFATPWTVSLPGSSVHGIFQARILECHILLQGIFLTQGSNLCLLRLLHWQADSLPLTDSLPLYFLVTWEALPISRKII